MNKGAHWRKFLPAGWILLCTGLSLLLVRQAMEPTANLVQYLPLMFHSKVPSLFPRDDFVALLVERTPTLFWWFFGKLLPVRDPYPHLFVLNLLTRIATLSLAWWVASGPKRDWKAGMVAVLLFSGPLDTVLGRGDINWAYFTHTAVVIPILLASLGFLLRGRTLLAFAIAGFAWNIHLLDAAYYSLFLAIWLLLSGRRIGWKHCAGSIGLAVLFALPVAPRILAGLSGGGVNPVWEAHMLDYYRKLLSPFEQPAGQWFRFGGYFALLIFLTRKATVVEEKAAGWAMAAMWLLLYVLGAVFVQVLFVPLFVKLQPFRSTDVFMLLFLPWFARDLAKGIQSRDRSWVMLHGIFFLMLFMFHLKIQPSILKDLRSLVWCLLIGCKLWREVAPVGQQTRPRGLLWLTLVWGCSSYVAVFAFLFNRIVAGQFEFVLYLILLGGMKLLGVLAVFLLLTYLVVLRVVKSHDRDLIEKRAAWLILGVFGLGLGFMMIGLVSSRTQRMNSLIFDYYHPEYFEAARWCREHTPEDALIIVPPYDGGFRGESLRSVFVSWDEQLALMIAPDYLPEYDHRLRLLGIKPLVQTNLKQTWMPSRNQILAVSRDYGADYLVIEAPKLMAFPMVYRNEEYCVYQLR